MSTLVTPAPQRSGADATAKSGEISSTLYHLTAIVRLAAFAAEARRTLTGIDDALHYREEMQVIIRGSVLKSAQWAMLEDSAGQVLDYVACQLEKVADDFTENFDDMGPARPVIPVGEKIGGVA